jgi:hypothetical protein
MRQIGLIALCVVGIGCGVSPVKYDAIKDKSSIHVNLSGDSIDPPVPGKPALSLLLNGEGKHPKIWEGALFVEYHTPKGEPDFLGDYPKLVLNTSTGTGREITAMRLANKENPSPSDDRVFFEVSLDDLAQLIEYGDTYTLNGKSFKLTPEEESAIRQAIVAVREDTNAGK